MKNPFPYSDNNKRYHALCYYNKQTFGGRVYKASINLNCSCPHIKSGGCTFCTRPQKSTLSVPAQLQRESKRIHEKNSAAKIIAYLQYGTNTLCDVNFLCEVCCDLLSFPHVVGISIGTRADCISVETANMLQYISSKTHLTVELGLQTVHDATAKRINRGHTFKDFLIGYEKLQSHDIRTCIHLINSLPGETKEMMIESAKQVGAFNPGGVKIHMLNILKGTALAKEYADSPFHIQSRDEYVDTVIDQLEYLPQSTVIERLTGDGIKSEIVAPMWAKDKLKTLVEIDKLQASKSSYQGKKLL